VCQWYLGGSIDPSVYQHRGGDALVWKSDGTDAIWSQGLGPDDTSLVGIPHQLLSPDAAFEDGVVEGPALVRIGGTLTLWFSTGPWAGSSYAIGMAVCHSVLGPCDAAVPELTAADGPVGPGGPSFFTDDGRLFLAFAAWVGDVRALYLAAVS